MVDEEEGCRMFVDVFGASRARRDYNYQTMTIYKPSYRVHIVAVCSRRVMVLSIDFGMFFFVRLMCSSSTTRSIIVPLLWLVLFPDDARLNLDEDKEEMQITPQLVEDGDDCRTKEKV